MVLTKADEALLYEADCAMFAEEKLGLDLHEQRIRHFLNTRADEVILLWSRQAGKTTGSAAKVTHRAVFSPGTLSLIVSATQRQAGILQGRVTKFMHQLRRDGRWVKTGKSAVVYEDPLDANSRMIRCSVLSMMLENGSEVVSVPASPETVRGYSPDLIVMDEAGMIPDEVYYAVRPMRIRTKAQLCVVSSAWAEVGFFYDTWKNREGWEKSEVKAKECAWVTAEELERERGQMPADRYAREYENVFMPMQGALLPADTIAAMYDEDEPMVVPAFTGRASGHMMDEGEDMVVLPVRRR